MTTPEENSESLDITLFSFGFKYGVPTDATMIWDVRFLPNPYWVEEMRPLTGLEPEVAAYVLESPEGRGFMELLLPLLQFVVEKNMQAKKTELRLAIGCTGGHHRSVALVEALKPVLEQMQVRLRVFHRDVDKE